MLLKIEAIGHVGNDATLREVNGKKVVNFSLAYTEKYKNADQVVVEKTTWMDCSLWDADKVAPYVKKGTLVYISGIPESRAYVTKDGEAKSTLAVKVGLLKLLSAASGAAQPKPTAQPADSFKAEMQAANVSGGEDDLPW